MSILGSPSVPLVLGMLRLGIEGRPSESDAVALLHEALDRGIRWIDTADSYCLDAKDAHYGERLAAQAVATWKGPREEVKIITKVGMTRPKGRWLPNARPEHLRKAVEGSLLALGVERLFVLQLHVHDPGVPFEDTLGALAELQREGKIEHLGLCNTTPAEIDQAGRHFRVMLVQNELSVQDRKSAQIGLIDKTRELGIPFLAHRPLGGYAKAEKLAKNRVLGPLAERHGVTPFQVALAALRLAGDHVLPIIGVSRPETLRSSLDSLKLNLDVSDRTALDVKYSFASEVAPVSTQPPAIAKHLGKDAEVVLLMGIQGAGKSRLVDSYVEKGYARLNRDLLGGKLDDLVPALIDLLANGHGKVVLDNTYPTRISRAPVIAAARTFGVPIVCRHLATSANDAHVNIALRMLGRYGKLLGPEEMKALAKTDPNLPPPVALRRWEKSFEAPALDEGFASVESVPFHRIENDTYTTKGLLLDVDGTLRVTKSGEVYPRSADDVVLIPGRREVLMRWVDAGYSLFLVSNQSGIASGKLTQGDAQAAFARTVELLGLPVAEIAYCPHPSFPVSCFCRKPMPGLGVALMEKYRLSRRHLIMVGDLASDAEFAAALGARYYEAERFFSLNGPSPT